MSFTFTKLMALIGIAVGLSGFFFGHYNGWALSSALWSLNTFFAVRGIERLTQ